MALPLKLPPSVKTLAYSGAKRASKPEAGLAAWAPNPSTALRVATLLRNMPDGMGLRPARA